MATANATNYPITTRHPITIGYIKIGFVAPCLLEGGAERWERILYNALVGTQPSSPVNWIGCCVLDENTSNADGHMRSAIAALMPVTFGEAALATLAAQVDILITWAVYPYGPLLDSLSNPPAIVYAAHMQDPWGTTETAWLSRCERFVASSPAAFAQIPDTYSGLASTILNAVDPGITTVTTPRTTMRSSWSVPNGDFVAGFIGRLATEKDPAAMTRLASVAPAGTSVVVVGAGPLATSLATAGESYANYHQVGAIDDAASCLAAFDTLIVPSLYESFGYSIAQGLYVGLPVICTNVGCATYSSGITRTIPLNATGAEINAAINADRSNADGLASRMPGAQSYAQSGFGMSRFANAWAALINGLFGA